MSPLGENKKQRPGHRPSASVRVTNTDDHPFGRYSCSSDGKIHAQSKNRNFWTYLQVALLVCTLTIGLSWYSLWEHYAVTRSRAMQVEAGRIIPLVSHGVVVYLTQGERQKLAVLSLVGDGMGLVFVLVSLG